MKKSLYIFTVLFSIIILLASSCNKDENNENLTIPILSTSALSEITSSSVTSGGNISSDGGSPIISRGVCWSTSPNPTKENSTTIYGNGVGNFSSTIEGLTSNQTYYIRAYATNEVGTAYGNELSFTTINENSNVTPQFEIFKVIDDKEILNIIKTADGGYIGIAFGEDYDVIKFDENFNIIWNKTYGGSQEDHAEFISQTSDGGYLVVGRSKSNDGDITGNHGEYDIWACKIDESGNLVWEKSYGGSASEGLSKEKSVLLTNDGGFIFTAYTKSNDGDVSINNGGYDVWIVKTILNGDIQSEKTLGGNLDDLGRSIIQTGSNYSVLIKSNSSDGDFSTPGAWVVMLNQDINILWKTNLNGLNTGFISETSDNNIIAVNNSADQFLISKLDLSGNVVLSSTIDFQSISSKQPFTIKIQETSDKGFIIIGVLGGGNSADALLFRVSPQLNLLYNKIYSGSSLDFSASFIPLDINNYIYHFFTGSHDIEGVEFSSLVASVIVKLEEVID